MTTMTHARAIRDTLEHDEDPALLDAFRRSALIPANDAEFDAILDVARSLDMAR